MGNAGNKLSRHARKRKDKKDDTGESKDHSRKRQKNSTSSSRSRGVYDWERKLLEQQVYSTGRVSHALIVTYKDRALRAVVPSDFQPDQQGIADIINALDGKPDQLAEHGLRLGDELPVTYPAKMDAGRAIYCTDSSENGCIVRKTSNCVLILFFTGGHAETVEQLAVEASRLMEENGR